MKVCERFRDSLPLFALGILEEESATPLLEHLEGGCSACRSELKELQEAVNMLPYDLPSSSAPVSLKDRLMERIRSAQMPFQISGLFDFAGLPWEESALPGVSIFWLRRDAATGTTAAIVKIRAGYSFQNHLHFGSEDCLVLQGHLRDARGEYKTGDYVFYEAGSVQRDLHALEGQDAIIFVVNQQGIEFVE